MAKLAVTRLDGVHISNVDIEYGRMTALHSWVLPTATTQCLQVAVDGSARAFFACSDTGSVEASSDPAAELTLYELDLTANLGSVAVAERSSAVVDAPANSLSALYVFSESSPVTAEHPADSVLALVLQSDSHSNLATVHVVDGSEQSSRGDGTSYSTGCT